MSHLSEKQWAEVREASAIAAVTLGLRGPMARELLRLREVEKWVDEQLERDDEDMTAQCVRLAHDNERLRAELEDAHDVQQSLVDENAMRNTSLLEAKQEVKRLRAEVAELRIENEGHQAVRAMTVSRLGGEVEGRPTQVMNFLQRIDELRKIEAEVAELRERNAKAAQAIREKTAHLESLGAMERMRSGTDDETYTIHCAHRVAEEGTCLCGKAAWVGKDARLGANFRKLVDDGDAVLSVVYPAPDNNRDIAIQFTGSTLDDAIAEVAGP